MSELNINIDGGTSTKLLTAGKYCDKDIIITASGGGGGELPDDFFLVTGNCSYRFAFDNMTYLLETEPFKNKWHTNNIESSNYMFAYCEYLEKVDFDLHYKTGSKTSPTYVNYTFYSSFLRELPELLTEVYVDGVSSIFCNCKYIRYIPQSWYDNLKLDYINNQTYASANAVFSNCYSLREVDSNFLKKCCGKDTSNAVSATINYGGFTNCSSLDEIVGLPTVGIQSSNMFSSTFTCCSRIKNLIFDTNGDGTAKVAQWKSQTIDLSNENGYTLNYENRILNYNSGITADKEVTDAATYEALKDDADWWTTDVAYSRYNHDSAVNTINSLPDTSAYLAANGGTNTIKFRGAAGSATDGGAINTLTEAEIAVAAAKGWTVSFSN